jgi:hypothetical protein
MPLPIAFATADEQNDASVTQFRQSLAEQEPEEAPPMTGEELYTLVMKRWGKAYDTRITKRRDRFYVEVMWFHLGQKSFPMSKEQFEQQLEAVAYILTDWRVQDQVRDGIKNTRKRPVMDTTGANAVVIPLNLPPDADTSDW